MALAALAIVATTPASALDFRLQKIKVDDCTRDCPHVIVASGAIYLDDYKRLMNLLAQSEEKRILSVMVIDSPGGQAGGGFRLAFLARHFKLTVLVGRPRGETAFISGRCHSACTFVLSGGTRRIVLPGSEVAVHWGKEPPPTFDPVTKGFMERPKLDDDAMATGFRQFFRSMGVSTKIVDLMRKTPFNEGRTLTPKELRALRLATHTKL
jgi:hypothetical protein